MFFKASKQYQRSVAFLEELRKLKFFDIFLYISI